MKTKFILFTILLTSLSLYSQSIWINEFHYQNTGADVIQKIEIAGVSGTDLAGYTIKLINGTNSPSSSYSTFNLSGQIDNEQNGFGAISFLPSADLQNGNSDGIALIDPANTIIQLISYEGVFVFDAVTSTDIGVSEDESTLVGQSLQLQGSGNNYSDFTWVANIQESPDTVNQNQFFTTLSILDLINDNSIIIYPNPTNNFVNLKSNSNITFAEIWNELGQKVKTINKNRIKIIDISNLSKGVYFIKFLDSKNNRNTLKVLKE